MERPNGTPALVASILLHGAIVAALVISIDNATPTAHGVGTAGVAVSLSPGGGGRPTVAPFETVDATDGAAKSVPTEDAQEETSPVDPELVEASTPDNVDPPAEKPAETSATDDVESPAEKPVEISALDDVKPSAEKPVEIVDAASETAATTPETVATLEPETIQPTPSKGAEPLPVTPRDVASVPPQTVAATTLVKIAAKKPKATAAQAAPDAPQSAAATTDSKPSDQVPAAATGAAATSTAAAAGGTTLDFNSPEGAADYIAVLQAWLEKHKQYPRRAQIRRLQGTALLYFSMDAEGHVLDFRVARSSGHTLLDVEVEAMIQRADPLPAAPASMRGGRLEFVVPVQFALR